MPKNPRILLIDDDEDEYVLVRDMLAEAFGRSPDLDWVSSWDDGLPAIAGDRYDVCLVDYRLGDRDGLDLIRKAVAEGCTAPTILMTGQDDREVDVLATEAGAADYLVKGRISPPLLERAIRYAIARQQFLKSQIEANELLRNKNARLAELYRTAHQIVDNVSHEFRTPLTVIREYISILQDGLAGPVSAEQKAYLGIAIERVDDLGLMVNDMLDISRLEAGLLGISRTACRVEEIVARIRPTLERKAGSRGVRLDIAIGDGLPSAYCDIEKIGRVIVNLAVNAIKFCGDAGRVTLWVRPGADPSEIAFGVTDNGPGIAAEDLGALFDRFTRSGVDMRSDAKGFGLGLSIAKQLVQLHFGDISVESEPARGSTFVFTVPVFEPSRIVERCLRRAADTGTGHRYSSLISVRVEPPADRDRDDEVEQFLHHQVRGEDLLFRQRPGAWLLVAAAGPQGLDALLNRLAKARSDANRNRIGDELPDLVYEVHGTWDTPVETAQLIARFRTEIAGHRKSAVPPRQAPVYGRRSGGGGPQPRAVALRQADGA